MKKNFLFLSILLVFLSACTNTNYSNINQDYRNTNISLFSNSSFDNIDSAIVEISNQLLLNISSRQQRKNKFVITTFVNLNDFVKTSKIARVISETLINEMHTRKFKIIDFRTQEALSVDKNGEFILTRDVKNLRDEIPESLLVVGTYSIINSSEVIINARVINNFTSEVLSTAKVIYKYNDCKLLNICTQKKKKLTTYIPVISDKQ